MTSDWKECIIGDICNSVSETYKGNDEQVVLINTSDVLEGAILNHSKVDNKNLKGQFKKTFKKNDILYSEIRPANKRFAFVNIEDTHNYIASTKLMVIRPDIDKVLPEYLYMLLKSQSLIDELQHLAETRSGTFPQVTFSSELSQMEINLPPLEIQRKIARVLGAIDDKIELNNSINKNLEQQAQAIYSNFIDNCENKIIKVSDITATANTGADAIQKAPIVDYDTGVKCIRVGDMSNNRGIYQWGYSKVTDDVFTQYQLKKDDILVTRTATLGLNRLITSDLNAVYNNGLIRLTVDKLKILPLILYRQFQTQDFFNFISRIESETSVRPNMKINYLLSYEFKCPDIDKQKELVDLITPIMNIKELNIQENNNLTQLRDTLLPKLMNGEIDVDKVEVNKI